MNTQTNERQVIESLINERIEAIKSQDIEKAVANYSEDLLMFDVIGKLSDVNVQSAKDRLTEWFSSMQTLLNYEVDIIDIYVNNNIAFCNSFNHIEAIKKDGGKLDMWWRETLGWKKQNGHWVVISAHSSVPFNGQTGKASLDLKPSRKFIKKTSKEDNIDLSNLVKSIFHAYETKDKAACTNLLTDDFTFTSPNGDDHIDKVAYFKRCWSFSNQKPVYEFEKIAVTGNDVFVLYNCRTKTGKRFRNTEMFKCNKDKIKAVEVFFGDTQK